LTFSTGFRVVRVLIGVVLIVFGAGLFVIFTGSINAATSNGPPIGIMAWDDAGWSIFVLALDLVFLSVIVCGVKLADLSWRVFGVIVLVAGAAILSMGIWNYVDGPLLDINSARNDDRFPVASELNILVYVLGGLCLLGGCMLTTRTRV